VVLQNLQRGPIPLSEIIARVGPHFASTHLGCLLRFLQVYDLASVDKSGSWKATKTTHTVWLNVSGAVAAVSSFKGNATTTPMLSVVQASILRALRDTRGRCPLAVVCAMVNGTMLVDCNVPDELKRLQILKLVAKFRDGYALCKMPYARRWPRSFVAQFDPPPALDMDALTALRKRYSDFREKQSDVEAVANDALPSGQFQKLVARKAKENGVDLEQVFYGDPQGFDESSPESPFTDDDHVPWRESDEIRVALYPESDDDAPQVSIERAIDDILTEVERRDAYTGEFIAEDPYW